MNGAVFRTLLRVILKQRMSNKIPMFQNLNKLMNPFHQKVMRGQLLVLYQWCGLKCIERRTPLRRIPGARKTGLKQCGVALYAVTCFADFHQLKHF
ncbi:hypothetical protein J6590_097086 [Homalodisca vitripennis]|nr:hypothetical protein J6590_097086 [Homalodisca vitripennis]